ncbi:hypothetical protein PAAG_12294 [Paracoccidioides lutzii Pb01]|uniref:Uncharacterized protein n=1 Tax=Paracoccidioides lutzii (strain ATCC MYA-826 / Pb01) TaxID=502779 RepID=A0A0A2V0L4_PARBA|nr:hypothetical protein PAAG_12294 [Paracoccidioides lutzii Pb01]KGQ01043.1 hypothetical protein PAAG_12294 [Paracoccidioides lutzii Pb01]
MFPSWSIFQYGYTSLEFTDENNAVCGETIRSKGYSGHVKYQCPRNRQLLLVEIATKQFLRIMSVPKGKNSAFDLAFCCNGGNPSIKPIRLRKERFLKSHG